MANLTIEQWMGGMVDYNLAEATIAAILFNNDVQPGANVAEVPLMNRELCLADLYMFLATSSTSTSGEYESDGGWQHQKSAKNVVDRAGLRARAMELYRKWNSDKATAVGSIVMKNLY